jgi:hypothetical protein
MTLIEAMRPYLWLTAIAFLVGFLSYVAIGPSSPAVAREAAAPRPAALAAPGPVAGEWNVPKRI